MLHVPRVPVDMVNRLANARQALEKMATAAQLAAAAKQVNTDPTDAQKESGNYRKGYYKLHGLTFVIENPKGSTRSGVSEDGKKWSTKMRHHYGYIQRTKGADDDPIDVFLNPEYIDCELVFVVSQVDPSTGKFNEHKSLFGFLNEEQAREGYLANYEYGWKGLGSIKAMTIEQFKEWLVDGDLTKKAASFIQVSVSHTRIMLRLPPRSQTPKKKNHVPTVAVDLDGTLAKLTDDVKTIGEPRPHAKEWLKKFKDAGARIIIFTVRGNRQQVKDWLDKYEMAYDYVNENPDQPLDGSGKVIADCYVDDRAVNAEDWDEAGPEALKRLEKSAAFWPLLSIEEAIEFLQAY